MGWLGFARLRPALLAMPIQDEIIPLQKSSAPSGES
jgi:hypothetical protein